MELTVVRSSFVKCKKLHFHRLSWKADETGPELLLIHGLGSNAMVWQLVAPHLVKAGLRPMAFDLRGHGRSSKPDEGYAIETMVEDLFELVKNCQIETPVLVGHSFGAMLALDYASKISEGNQAPAGIVLVDGGMAQLDTYPGVTWEGVQQVLAPPRHAGMTVEEFIAYLSSDERKWQPSEQATEAILANYEILDDGTIQPHMTSERYMEAIQSLWEYQTYASFERLRCPVLMLAVLPMEPHNLEERVHIELKKDAIQRGRNSIRDFNVRWLEDTVHDVLLHKPLELTNEIIAFVDS